MRISTSLSGVERIVYTALALALGVTAWMFIGPERLGGSSTYVMVHGSSMEPNLRAGDLVIVRQSGQVKVGDIVAYRSRDLGVPVLHRIVGIKNGNYRFKGDHNSWIDRESVSQSDLMGQSWVRIPKAGAVLEWTRTPAHAPLLTVPAALLLFGGFRTRKRRSPRKRNVTPGQLKLKLPALRLPSVPSAGATVVHGPVGQVLLAAVCLVATASVFIGILAFSSPPSVAGAATIAYKHEGTFTYSAATNRRFVYDAGSARTGQPIFLRLSHAVDFGFSYVLRPAAQAQVSGRASLTAVVKDTNGWRRTIALGPSVRFTGKHVKLRGRLDLTSLRGLIARIENATGVHRAGYEVAITPQIDVAGVASGRGFQDRFSPELQFQLDALQLAPVAAAANADGTANPLRPTETGSLALQGTTQGTFRLFTARVEVTSARRLALVGGFTAILGALALALLAFHGRKASEAARINARFGWSLIPVTASTSPTGRANVKLDSMDALVRLAERRDEAVLHAAGLDVDSYFFEEGGIVYWYRTPETADGAPPLGEPIPVSVRKRNVNGSANAPGAKAAKARA